MTELFDCFLLVLSSLDAFFDTTFLRLLVGPLRRLMTSVDLSVGEEDGPAIGVDIARMKSSSSEASVLLSTLDKWTNAVYS